MMMVATGGTVATAIATACATQATIENGNVLI